MTVKVSIITPFYNPSDEKIIISRESILAQTCKDFEWIQVDDGSNDDEVYESDIRLDRNFGASVARNVGFQISSGSIITYLDMGDELNPMRVENLIDIFQKNKCKLLFSAYYIVQNGRQQLFDHFNWINTPKFPTALDYIRVLSRQNIAIPLGMAHTRKPFVDAGGFQRGIVCGEDGILWRRMYENHLLANEILFTNDIAGSYFVSENGQSRTQRRPDMGGFAFDGSRNDHAKYLDEDWYRTFSSEGLYD